jgi:hypothetical protein
MANTSFNTSGYIVSFDNSIPEVTGAFAGFTALTNITVINFVDYEGTDLASTVNWYIPAGTTIPLYCSYISVSAGDLLLYPLSTAIPQI